MGKETPPKGGLMRKTYICKENGNQEHLRSKG